MYIVVTGCAGFIGFHLTKRLLKTYNIIGIDNLNDYYDQKIKKDRLNILKNSKKKNEFHFFKKDITNYEQIKNIYKAFDIKIVIHLAAQAGVRYSIDFPRAYTESNLVGFFNILDLSKKYKIKHFIFASTSSVYGNNKSFPLKETEKTELPLSYYAATKKSNELMAHAYSNIYKLPCTGLRFFTVYGPYGRPDMSLFKFTDSIIKGNKIELYNKGNHYRDFTYIDDVVESIRRLINKPSRKEVPFEIFNIGSSRPKYLKDFLKLIEKNLSLKSKLKMLPLQPGDVHKTYADNKKLYKKINYKPQINVENGIKRFIDWYLNYFKL